jgi:DNA-directed RNA polymerase
MTDWNTLLLRQKELEDRGVADGVTRFREKIAAAQKAGRGSQVGAAKKMLSLAVDPMTKALEDMLEEGKGRPGRRHYVERWIKLLGPEPLAFLTAKCVLDCVTDPSKREAMSKGAITLRNVAANLAGWVVDEARYRKFQREAPGLFDYRMARFNTSSYVHMAKSLDAAVRYAEIDTKDCEMPNQVRLVVGIKLIDMFAQATGLVGIESIATGKRVGKRYRARTETFLVAMPDTLKWLSDRNDGLETLFPVFAPMVVPPVQWAPGVRGGYRFALRGRHPLVRGISKQHAQTVKATPMPMVYDAVNRIQETPWKINQDVLSLLKQLIDSGVSLAGVPQFSEEPKSAKPVDIASNEDARKRWRKTEHGRKEREHVRRLACLQFQKTYRVATSMQDEAAIYFPCNLDFRGRVYNAVNYLHPQGNDLSKALLRFAEGKPLGEHGATWLALHGANCLGETPQGVKLSRLTLQERVDAIVALTPDIRRAVESPVSENFLWSGPHCDDPLQFYAFCCEWVRYVEARIAGRGEGFVSTIPCAMDGTCNGLQHFAALLLDEVGGDAVNLVPQERPQDIYTRVANAVLELLEQDATTNAHARLWLSSQLINRKIAKRPVMTFPYGSKKFGFQQQTIEYVKTHERWSELKVLFTEEGSQQPTLLNPACAYLAGLIWRTLQTTVVAAAAGMDWMQQAARDVVRNRGCVSWAVPTTNFPVRQEYFTFTSRRIETVLAGKLYKPMLYTETDTPDIIKQANAVAPNVVHSLDAAALMLTVNAAAARGVTAFGMVHDSYGTHAGDCEVLAEETRRQFIRLYEEDVIGGLAKDWREQAGKTCSDDFPTQPMKGSLNLHSVQDSFYFFS